MKRQFLTFLRFKKPLEVKQKFEINETDTFLSSVANHVHVILLYNCTCTIPRMMICVYPMYQGLHVSAHNSLFFFMDFFIFDSFISSLHFHLIYSSKSRSEQLNRQINKVFASFKKHVKTVFPLTFFLWNKI